MEDFMKIVCACLLLAGISTPVLGQSVASSQTKDAKPTFTLEITANLVTGHATEWDFVESSETTVKAGQTVVVRIRKTNISDREIDKWSATGLTYEIRDGDGNRIKPREFDQKRGDGMSGGGAMLRDTKDTVLQPGENKAISARMDDWYEELSQPGTYTIQVSEHISADPASDVVKSNKITVTVLPADDPPPVQQ
jgi:hypothetical protein